MGAPASQSTLSQLCCAAAGSIERSAAAGNRAAARTAHPGAAGVGLDLCSYPQQLAWVPLHCLVLLTKSLSGDWQADVSCLW